jgi:TM2 domain-containing membrane protein YozV
MRRRADRAGQQRRINRRICIDSTDPAILRHPFHRAMRELRDPRNRCRSRDEGRRGKPVAATCTSSIRTRGDDEMTHEGATQKNTTVAYLLWFFLGGFGAHRMYCDRMKSGLGMLGLFVASCVLTLVVVGVVGFIALTAWWVVDAFHIGKWINGQPDTDVAGLIDELPVSQAA